MKTLEDAIKEINDAGYLINNLFQSQAFSKSGEPDWQANIRTPLPNNSCFEFGRGATPALALAIALEKAKNPTKKPPFSNDIPVFLSKATVHVEASLEDLL